MSSWYQLVVDKLIPTMYNVIRKEVRIMIKTIRVMLLPNNKQKTKLFQYSDTARFAYNWALGREQANY